MPAGGGDSPIDVTYNIAPQVVGAQVILSFLGIPGTNYVLGDNGAIHGSGGTVATVATVDSATGSNDSITVGAGTNYVLGGFGLDTITAGAGTNFVFGDNGAINLSGGVLTSVATADSGIGSDDTIFVAAGTNYVMGGYGSDTVTVWYVLQP